MSWSPTDPPMAMVECNNQGVVDQQEAEEWDSLSKQLAGAPISNMALKGMQHQAIKGHSSPRGLTGEDLFSAYRQRQGHARPPLQVPMPGPPQMAYTSQPGPAYGSEYGSLDRSSLSGSEAVSPPKNVQVHNEPRQKYMLPTPFVVTQQPIFGRL